MSLSAIPLWAVMVPLLDPAPAPEDVKPGWLGFAVFLLLALAVVFLALSFRKQLRRVTFKEEEADGSADRPSDGGEGPSGKLS